MPRCRFQINRPLWDSSKQTLFFFGKNREQWPAEHFRSFLLRCSELLSVSEVFEERNYAESHRLSLLETQSQQTGTQNTKRWRKIPGETDSDSHSPPMNFGPHAQVATAGANWEPWPGVDDLPVGNGGFPWHRVVSFDFERHLQIVHLCHPSDYWRCMSRRSTFNYDDSKPDWNFIHWLPWNCTVNSQLVTSHPSTSRRNPY